MKILITGSDGFIARNLIAELRGRGHEELLFCNRSTTKEELEGYIERCDVLMHLAGVNRPEDEAEYTIGNVGFTEEIVETLMKHHKRIPVVFTSTILNTRHGLYGESKRKAEVLLQGYAEHSGALVFIFRLPNVFGKWCRPNYNSFVATFCYNIAHDLDIRINDSSAQVTLAYIDDVIEELISCIDRKVGGYMEITETCQTTVGEVAERIIGFKRGRETIEVPHIEDALGKKLYSTYLSYLEPENFRYKLNMHQDRRGSFTEFVHLKELGQISVNVAKPGIVKGNHWHHTKVEKFLVVSGTALIKLRHIVTDKTAEYTVSGECLEVVEIPIGYAHSITNIGKGDLVTIIWANEVFDSQRPDTYYEEV